MESNELLSLLYTQIPRENILINEPMKDHTSFKIGGPADLFIRPTSVEQLIYIIKICDQYNIDRHIIGNGTNLLVDDKGIRGIVIQLYKNFSAIEVKGTHIIAQSGALLSKLANTAFGYELSGLEFAQGIPGTLGGAVAMNAGAYGGEMKEVILEAKVIDLQGNLLTLSKEELALRYRKSIVQTNNYIVVEATLALHPGNVQDIAEVMKDFAQRRREKQPLEMPSAGSTFKRPEGYFAGKLIMDAGLRGYKIGGAVVSEKHCGFVVSDGTATFEDVQNLLKYIQSTVYEKFHIHLEPEIKIISRNRSNRGRGL